MLERLRRSVSIRIDATGRTWIDGEAVTHPRIEQAIRDGTDVTESGEHRMMLGNQWCYLQVDDCPVRVTGVSIGAGDVATLRLDDGREVELDPSTVVEDAGRGLRCAVPSRHSPRQLAARFTNVAQMDLAPHIDDSSGPPALHLQGKRWPLESA